ncbi:MAG: hypothetical protein QF570_18835 [Myxococcota bacterium]|jgi:hypothetical protein|nr:hypothetical protein [Myxococcota bacterium]
MSGSSHAAAEAGDSPGKIKETKPRRRYELDDRGFDEVPRKYRKYYRKWEGPDDELAPNEALCPVCKIVMRSVRELRDGDQLYCMACMTRVRIVSGENGRLETRVTY